MMARFIQNLALGAKSVSMRLLMIFSPLCVYNFCIKSNDSLIRDRTVIGLRCRETVQKLCAVSGLSLSRAISVCRAEEAAARDVSQVYGDGTSACRVSDNGTAGAGGVTLQLMTNWTVSRGAGRPLGRASTPWPQPRAAALRTCAVATRLREVRPLRPASTPSPC